MKYTVKYISNKCSQTDDLANKPHESVAKSLMSILHDHNEIKHPVIGVEGSWGSGKSQVINILQKLASNQQVRNICFTLMIFGVLKKTSPEEVFWIAF